MIPQFFLMIIHINFTGYVVFSSIYLFCYSSKFRIFRCYFRFFIILCVFEANAVILGNFFPCYAALYLGRVWVSEWTIFLFYISLLGNFAFYIDTRYVFLSYWFTLRHFQYLIVRFSTLDRRLL